MNEMIPAIDPETGIVNLDEWVMRMPSYQRIMADHVVTAEELQDQSRLVADRVMELQSILPDTAKSATWEALAELAVLAAVARSFERQQQA